MSAATKVLPLTEPRPNTSVDPVPGWQGTERLQWCLATVPFVAALLLGTLALRVRLTSGVWPSFDQPDPSDLGLHHDLVILGAASSVAMVAVIPLVSVASWLLHRNVGVRPLIVGTLGCFMLIAMFRLDIGGLATWVGD